MSTALLPTLPWNLVTRNLHGHPLLRKKLRQKIAKLERHLVHFPPDAVHLHLLLERNAKKDHYTAALTLRVPSNILRSEKSGPDLIRAFDTAVKALLRELTALKARLRRETFWKRKERREQLHALKASGFAPEPQAEGQGPQSLADVLRALLQQHHARLLRYVRRALWHETTAGELPPNAIDPRAVVDEVARQALAAPEKKPDRVSYLVWLYALARRELARRRRALRAQAAQTVALETPQPIPDEAEVAAGYDPEQPLDLIEQQLEPAVARAEALVPDQRVPTPAEAVADRELLAQTRKLAATWPRPEREVFELYFVEGFDPDEVAMIVGRPTKAVEQTIQSIQNRLRAAVTEQALV